MAQSVACSAAFRERIEQLELDYAATLRRCGEIRDGAEAAQARLDALIAMCDQVDALGFQDPILRVVAVRAAATGADPEAEAT